MEVFFDENQALKRDLENALLRGDIQFDRAESLQCALKEALEENKRLNSLLERNGITHDEEE